MVAQSKFTKFFPICLIFLLTAYTNIFPAMSEMQTLNGYEKEELLIQWDMKWGTKNYDTAEEVLAIDEGLFFTGIGGDNESDIWLLKTTLNGSVLLNKTLERAGFESVEEIIPTSDNGFLLTGWNSLNANREMLIIKLDNQGNEEWSQTIGHDGYDTSKDGIETLDGGYIFVGATNSIGNGDYDIWVVKLDNQGIEIWNKTFGFENQEFGTDIIQLSDKGFLLSGWTNSIGSGDFDFWVVKIDENGSHLWDKSIGGEKSDKERKLIEITEDEFIIAGSTESYGAGRSDGWLVKINGQGEVLWNKTYGGDLEEEISVLSKTLEKTIIFGGYTESFGSGRLDIWLVNIQEDGSENWMQTFGGSLNDVVLDVIQTCDLGYAIAGFSWVPGRLSNNYIIKTFDKSTSQKLELNNDGIDITGEKLIQTCQDIANNAGFELKLPGYEIIPFIISISIVFLFRKKK